MASLPRTLEQPEVKRACKRVCWCLSTMEWRRLAIWKWLENDCQNVGPEYSELMDSSVRINSTAFKITVNNLISLPGCFHILASRIVRRTWRDLYRGSMNLFHCMRRPDCSSLVTANTLRAPVLAVASREFLHNFGYIFWWTVVFLWTNYSTSNTDSWFSWKLSTSAKRAFWLGGRCFAQGD